MNGLDSVFRKLYLLRIDFLFFHDILNKQCSSVESRLSNNAMSSHLVHPDAHVKFKSDVFVFECGCLS